MRKYVLLLLIGSLMGCQTTNSVNTARSLNALQGDYSDLVQTEQACDKEPRSSDLCASDFRTLYSEIQEQAQAAIEARAQATDDGELQITIGLYRLAAFAAKSAHSGKAADFGANGLELCRKVSQRPPRDCAVLGVVGQYEVAEAFDQQVECLLIGSANCDLTLDQAVGRFCPRVYGPLAQKTASAKAGNFIDPSLTAYLDFQLQLATVSIKKLDSFLKRDLGLEQRPRTPCDCMGMAPSDPDYTAQCGAASTNHNATVRAACIVQRLAEETPTCPAVPG